MRMQRGFSIIELSVAMALGLVVTGAVLATFVSMHSASGVTSGESVVADNGRIALDVIQQALRAGGYMACNSTQRQAVSMGGVAPTPMTYDFTEAISAYEAVGTSPGSTFALNATPAGDLNANDWTSIAALGDSLDASVTTVGQAAGYPPIKGSDVIAVHTTYSQVQPVYSNGNSGVSTVPVQVTTGLQANQLAIVSNCAWSEVDEIQTVGATAVTFKYPLLGTYAPGAQVAVADTIVFYIGKGTDGDGALFMYELAPNPTFQTPAVEIVPDVENMQILYGVDTTGQWLSATEYVTADQVATAAAGNTSGCLGFNCVISVKVAVLAASPLGTVPKPPQAQNFSLLGTTITAPQDTRARQSFDMTISLRDNTN